MQNEEILSRGFSESDTNTAFAAKDSTGMKLEINTKAMSKRQEKDAFDWFREKRKYFYLGFLALLLALAYIYFKKMSLETFSRTMIVGIVYFLMILAVIIIEALIVKAAFVSARKKDEPGMFKDIFMMVIAADFFMLFLLPFTIEISIWISVVPATLIFGMVMLVFTEFNINAVIASAWSYCFLNFMILFIIKNTATPQIIVRFFIGG